MKDLWILTEERPKNSVIESIVKLFADENKCGFFKDTLHIIPILNKEKRFSFTYEVIGFKCAKIGHIYLRTVSGSSSFVDYLVFYQNTMPTAKDTPIFAIEETKTDDSESRNTGVYQRCSKFVFLSHYYPTCKKYMLYSLHIPQKVKPTQTYIFGTRLLLTIGVQIIGKQLDAKVFKPFKSIDEVITFKNAMHLPNRTNVPILLKKTANKIQISGRLYKSGSLSHDPNIGALSIISLVLRCLGWKGKIEITQHGCKQGHIGIKNKFVQIANYLHMSMQGIKLPVCTFSADYWHYDTKGEKLGTIFIHLAVENFTTGYSIFENHAGCEKSYFRTSKNEYIPLQKYVDRELYKAGDKDQIVFIPDLVLLDVDNKEGITIEGKKAENKLQGIAELANYDAFEDMYFKKHYTGFRVVRTVVLYGGKDTKIAEVEVGFLLNSEGRLVLGIKAPKLFKKAITNVLDYWK